MSQRSLQFASLLLLASLPVLGLAQETTGKEDERMETLAARNNQQWMGPRNKVDIGIRFLSSGGKVSFGNLGAVSAKPIAPASAGDVDRVYDNGTVNADGVRANEVDANGHQTSTPGGRYITTSTAADGTITQTGDYLSYTPGLTRMWSEDSQAQLDARPGYVGFTNYSTTSEGGHLTDKAGPAMGVELQFSRDLGRVSRRVQWGFTTGVTLNSISNKTSGSVTATLNTRTDYYQTTAPVTTAPAGGPIFLPLNTDDLTGQGLEVTVPLNQTPDESLTTHTATPGGAIVDGRWEIKGAYLLVKLGPSIRVQFNDHWELTASVGFAGAYAGTTYTSTETFTVPGVYDYSNPTSTTDASGNTVTTYPLKTDLGVTDPQTSTATKFLTGYYADLTLEWLANDTTGLYAGVTAQQLSSYEQIVGDHTATIDLGSTVGIRSGISIKF